MKQRKKLIVAAIGPSKVGKTSFINSLACNPKEMLQVHAKNEARTKVTVNYEFVPYSHMASAKIIGMSWNRAKLACGGDYKNVDGYNKAVRENVIYKHMGFELINDVDNLYYELDKQITQIQKEMSLTKIMELINTEGIDEYITSITIEVPANRHLSLLLERTNICLVIRDTRGLLDLMVEDGNDNTKSIHLKPLAELGLDGINGIIFLTEGLYQDSIAKIYKRMLRTVMNSVPVFLACRDRSLKTTISSVEEAKDVLASEKNNEDEFEDKFYEVLNFLSSIKIVKEVDGEFRFTSFNYFENWDVEYLYPECMYLSKLKRGKEVGSDPLYDSSYENYSNYTSFIISDIIEKLLGYYDELYSIISGNALSNVLRKYRYKFQEDVEKDFLKYDDRYKGPKYARPQVNYESHNSLSEKLCDRNVDILGPRDGITTPNGKKMKYITTGVAGVTIERALRKWIKKQSFYQEITVAANIDDEKKDNIIRKALLYVLQKRFVDYYATFQGYNCMNRYIIRDNIKAVRDKNVTAAKAMYEYAGFVLDDFCSELEKIGKEAAWNLIVDCGKNTDYQC